MYASHTVKLLPRLAVLAAFLWAAPAMPHALAERTSPGASSVLDRPPAAVSVYFDARLEPLFSKLTVTNEAGVRISQGSGEVPQGQPKVLTARIVGTAKGLCHVYWDVVSRDGHRAKGDYTFTVR